MYNAALDYGPDQTAGQVYSGDGFGPVYKNWEAEFLMMCICDWGTMGPECGTRMCPKGFDPLKTSAVFYREINVTTNATAVGAGLNGTFVMTFDGFSFEFDANATLFDDAACEVAWSPSAAQLLRAALTAKSTGQRTLMRVNCCSASGGKMILSPLSSTLLLEPPLRGKQRRAVR